MSSSFYDVVVAGTDLSGLIFAASAAKRGYRVLIVGQDSRPESYRHQGFRFFRRPPLAYDLSASPAAERVLVDVGLNIELRNRFTPCRPRYQFVTARHRFDFDADPTVLAREIEREFPGQLPVVERHLRAVADDNLLLQGLLESQPPAPPEGFRQRRRLRQASASVRHLAGESSDPLRGQAAEVAVRAMLAAPVAFLGVPSLDSPARLPWTRAAAHAAQGFQELPGGREELARLFVEKVVAHCGGYRPDVSIGELEMVRGKVTRLQLRHRAEEVGCRLLVCNTEPKRFFGLIPRERQKERFHLTLHSLQPSHYLATMNFALAGDIVEEGMGPVVFFVAEPAAPLEEANLVLLTVPPAERREEGAPASRVLTAACRVPARRFAPRPAFARQVADELRAVVARVVPFLEERVLATHMTWIPAGEDGRDLDMDEVIPLYSSFAEGSLDGSPLVCRTAYKNILLGGDVLFSGYGLEGAFLGAQALLRHTMERVVLKSLLHG